jgi:XRE family transcriptional regulator, fatty acid utilization regulator
VEGPGLCPLWNGFDAFAREPETQVQLVELEDGSRWLMQARGVERHGARAGGVRARFAVGLGLAAKDAASLAAARGIDLSGSAVPIGLGCRACTRPDCPQRSAAPAGRAIRVREGERGVSGVGFAGD